MRHVAIICNPVAATAKAKQVKEEIASILTRADVVHTFFQASWPQNWSGITDAWIVGGDGTLNKFINAYPDINLPISPFKGGSANDFNWMLFGDITVAAQVEKALHGEETKIDGGDCNGTVFINGAGIGFDGAIVKDLIGKTKQVGKASYLFSVLRHMANFSEKKCVIHANGDVIAQECLMISVANGKRYGGGFCVAPEAMIDDGQLDVGIVGKISPLKRMKYLPVIEKGAHLGLPFVKYFKTGEVEIKANTPLPAHLDGEFISSDQFSIRCLPKKFVVRR
jgi:diacylglycerol kinase (ATP)